MILREAAVTLLDRPASTPPFLKPVSLTVLLLTSLLALAATPASAATGLSGEGCAVTPGGWGAPPAGHNPGWLLHNTFDEVLGASFAVGPHVFEDAQEVTDTLPAHGDPLLSHTVALFLNLAYGREGRLDGSLAGVVVMDGPHAGLTADEVLALALDALNDPHRSTSRYSSLITAMDKLNNEAYGCAAANAIPCPENVSAEALEDGSIRLTWTGVTGATGYKVYRGTGSGTLAVVATVPGTTYLDTTTTTGTTYVYQVTATDGTRESSGCPAVEATAIPFFTGGILVTIALIGGVAAFLVFRQPI